MRAARTDRRSCGLQGPLAEFAQRVVAALEQLACDGQAGAVAAEPFGRLLVVVVVGGAGPAGALGGFEERPAQRRWALAREVAGRAAGVGLVDGDIQAGVANGRARRAKAARVAEFGEDRDRGQRPDSV